MESEFAKGDRLKIYGERYEGEERIVIECHVVNKTYPSPDILEYTLLDNQNKKYLLQYVFPTNEPSLWERPSKDAPFSQKTLILVKSIKKI